MMNINNITTKIKKMLTKDNIDTTLNVLYLHGLDGRPDKNKIEYFKSKGCNVIAPKIDYRASKGQMALFDSLFMVAENNDIGLIVGDYLGGYVALNIGNRLGIRVIATYPSLGNPAFDLPVRERSSEFGRKKIVFWPKDHIYDETTKFYDITLFTYEGKECSFETWQRDVSNNIDDLFEPGDWNVTYHKKRWN